MVELVANKQGNPAKWAPTLYNNPKAWYALVAALGRHKSDMVSTGCGIYCPNSTASSEFQQEHLIPIPRMGIRIRPTSPVLQSGPHISPNPLARFQPKDTKKIEISVTKSHPKDNENYACKPKITMTSSNQKIRKISNLYDKQPRHEPLDGIVTSIHCASPSDLSWPVGSSPVGSSPKRSHCSEWHA